MTRANDTAPPLRLGLIGRAHGLAGAFRVVGAADWYEFSVGAGLLLDGRPREVLSVAGTPQSPIIELGGITSREQAAAVLGHALELPASDAPEPEEDAFWVRDLIGMRARCGERAAANSSAICTAFVAAPLRRLSLTHQNAMPPLPLMS